MLNGANINSPCNNFCEIDAETNLCRGCFRTIDEIISWIKFSNAQKLDVLQKVEERKKLTGTNNDAQTY